MKEPEGLSFDASSLPEPQSNPGQVGACPKASVVKYVGWKRGNGFVLQNPQVGVGREERREIASEIPPLQWYFHFNEKPIKTFLISHLFK